MADPCAVDPAASSSSDAPASSTSCTVVVLGDITPEQAGDAFAWGFSAVLLCYCTAWGIGQVLKAVR